MSPEKPIDPDAEDPVGGPEASGTGGSSSEEGGEGLDQTSLDAWIAEGAREEPSADKGAMPLDQAELDALIEAQQAAPAEARRDDLLEGKRPEIEKEPVTDPAILEDLLGPDYEPESAPVEPTEEPGPLLLDQAELDAMVASQGGQTSRGADPPDIQEDEIVSGAERPDQSDVDALVDEFKGAEEAAATEVAEEAPVAEEIGLLGQADIDALIAKGDEDSVLAGGGVEETLDESDMDEVLVAPSEDALPGKASDQSEIDTLVAEIGDQETPPGRETVDEEVPATAEPIEVTPEPLDAMDAPAATEEVVGSENIAAAAAPAVSEAVADVSADVSQELLDQLLQEAEKPDGIPEAVSESPPEPQEEAVPQPVAAEVEAVRAEEAATETVAEAATETVAEAATETVAEAAAVAVVDEVPEAVPAKGRFRVMALLKAPRVSDAVRAAVREAPLRAVSGLAVGVLVAVATFAYLWTHQLRSVDDFGAIAAGAGSDIERAMVYARNVMEKGSYGEAVDVLDKAIRRAPESIAKTDAKFLRIEAKYRALPEKLEGRAGEGIHGEIDRLVEVAREHPRAPEALYWKARVYEIEDNPTAAHSTYREILANYGHASNRDSVLFSIGELELATKRPLEAGEHLQELIQEHPGSPLAPGARLMIGDAFAGAHDIEGARIAYIQSAQTYADTRLGAEAFERLGKLEYEAGNYKTAIRDLETRLNTATTVEGNDGVYLILAKAYRAEGRLQDSRNMLNELIQFFPESDVTPLAFVELTQVLNDLGMSREAVRLATQTVQRYPANPAVLRNEGVLLAQAGDMRSAGRALMAADAAGADDPELLLAAGRHFRKGGALEEAKDAFERLTELFPRSPQALQGGIEWAKAVYAEGQVGKALERLEDLALATEGQPQRLPVLVSLGELYEDLELLGPTADVFGQIAASTTEPEMLAKAAVALLRAEAEDEGLAVAERVDVAKLRDETAYALLTNQGRVLLRLDSGEGLELMEQAYEAYPLERTAEGDHWLLKANLALNRTARARALVTELQARVLRREHRVERPRLVKAATTWGDFLFERGDYRVAADAYAMALGDRAFAGDGESPGVPEPALTPEEEWALYQRANAMLNLADFEGSIALFDRLAVSNSTWSKDAEARAASARLEQRLRGLRVSPPRSTG